MFKNLLSLIVFVSFVVFAASLKENTPFEMHDQILEDAQHVHKNPRKTRITDKEKFALHDFLGSLKETFSSIKEFTSDIFDSFVLRKTKPSQKESLVYRENFASQNGGAQILMVSSSKIKSPKAILRTDPDAYLFTADVLPITIVIGLKEQILIESFAIQSGQFYSCITMDFMLEGAFSLESQEWMFIGNFTAQNSFQTQQFAVEQKIIRYIRLTILSSYGKWKYFTLSQVKVYGQGLFSHAMENLLSTEYHLQSNKASEKIGNESIEEINSTSLKKLQTKKIQTKKIQTNQILVEAFGQLIEQGQQDRNQKNKIPSLKQTSQNDSPTDETKTNNFETFAQKQSPKDKKSINNLKKKISYLEKRNFELSQEIKELKKRTEEKLFDLETKHTHESDSTGLSNREWYETLLSSESVILVSVIINILCLVLVGLVFKLKIVSSGVYNSQRMESSKTTVSSGQLQYPKQSSNDERQNSEQKNKLKSN